MTATNYIYPFAQGGGANVISTAAYAASSITTTTAYAVDSIAPSAYMSKAQRQTSAMAAGLGQFIADNQVGTTDVTDDLSPATLAAMLEDATSNSVLGSIITQPQFDNSTKAATTAFVQRALGSMSGLTGCATNTTLTNSAVGTLVYPSASSLTLTLPLATGCAYGSILKFNGNALGATITAQGGETINLGSQGAVSSFALLSQDTAVLVNIGGWSLIEGETHQAVSSSFDSSLATDGYQYLPGGYIEQWGQTVGNIPANTSATITLPFSFPNAMLNIQLTPAGINHNANTSAAAAEIISTSQFVIHNWGAINFSEGVYYRIIGK